MKAKIIHATVISIMATIKDNTMYGLRIQLKYKAAADWGNDEVLLAGELGFEKDTRKYKLGDGTTKWSELDYYKDATLDAIITALTERVTTAESTLASHEARISALEGITILSANPAPADEPEGKKGSQETETTPENP